LSPLFLSSPFPFHWISLFFGYFLNLSFQWNIRITKRDTTFATITCALDITAGELCLILGKKFFIRRDDSFQLYLQKGGFGECFLLALADNPPLNPFFFFFFFFFLVEWHLEPDENPVKMEEQFFTALGYLPEDKMEQLGRKDHGYLFDFVYADRSRNRDKQVPFEGCHHPLHTLIHFLLPLLFYKS